MAYAAQIIEIIDGLANKLVQYGQELQLDGVKVFYEEDPFLPGKIAMGLAYWVTEYPSDNEITKLRCRHYRKLMNSLIQRNIESWGIHFYLKALWALDKADLLSECFSASDLERLRKKLDWRSFVDQERGYALVKKPNNFYGIAYSIAYTRYQLGWEPLTHSKRLLEKELDHYENESGGEGFADETSGKGRFDRYSFLLIAEIAYRFYEAGLPLTHPMKKCLKASADYVLFNINDRGDGFQWGRSVGAYGDSAFLEILTAASVHNLLNKKELAAACFFSKRITEKFLTFWYDKSRESINIWSSGRATDAYRGKNRILGENFSLLHQHLYCQRVWEKYPGYEDDHALLDIYKSWVSELPALKTTEFKKSKCQYLVVTFRTKDEVVNIPLVNGDRHYNQMAYQAIPFINSKIGAIPDYVTPIFRAVIRLSDGEEYLAYPCYEMVEINTKGETLQLSFTSSSLTQLGKNIPEKKYECEQRTSYSVSAGKITGKETWILKGNSKIVSVKFLTLQPGQPKGAGDVNNFSSNKKLKPKNISVWSGKRSDGIGVALLDPQLNGTERVYEIYQSEFTPDHQEKFTLCWEYQF